MKCNIDKTDRINRVVIGIILVLGALIGLGKVFLIVVGIFLIIEGAIGWCSIPIIISKLKQRIKIQ